MISVEPVALAFTRDEIRQQLKKIFADPNFSVSDILKRFLNFISEETIDGRSNQIKEYTIGLNVLNKAFGFNPKEDAIVRIHAGRLRRALNNYYRTAGASDAIFISMPKGSYVPFFTENKKNVLEGDALKRMEDLPLDNSPALTGTFTVTGEMQFINEHLRIHVHMLNTETQQEIWSQLIEYKISQNDVFDIQDDVAKKLISAVGDYCRLIKQAVPETAKMAVVA
jgi:TolB-like protein